MQNHSRLAATACFLSNIVAIRWNQVAGGVIESNSVKKYKVESSRKWDEASQRVCILEICALILTLCVCLERPRNSSSRAAGVRLVFLSPPFFSSGHRFFGTPIKMRRRHCSPRRMPISVRNIRRTPDARLALWITSVLKQEALNIVALWFSSAVLPFVGRRPSLSRFHIDLVP